MTSTRQQILKRVDARKPLPPPARRAELRKGAHLRLLDIAEVVGVSITTVSYWEKGRSEPSGTNRDAYLGILQTLEEAVAS